MAIEEIVKVNVPFTGTFENKKVHTKKRRFTIPSRLRKTYKFRQKKKSFKQCISFVAPGKFPIIATMKDNPSERECSEYNLVRFDNQGRFIMPFNTHGIDRADYICHGTYVEISATDQSSSTS